MKRGLLRSISGHQAKAFPILLMEYWEREGLAEERRALAKPGLQSSQGELWKGNNAGQCGVGGQCCCLMDNTMEGAFNP